ncbi:HD/PDEase domain [Syntrophomonas zehnderi OL-4]|uniref:HD/PDEase domain n=1 Tax=Syntrophomonas zehnderi OL-4 TaxID=690567 RepID=A0A0E4C9P0_9FIRM|nr:HD domain-containing protein [Syntrophomonas zehnderi]CFY07724.1 HD/PDEase domain [Syntrophomonas zehnderi OL-4]
MLNNIAWDIANQGGRVFYSGGYVRDYLLTGQAELGKDIDLEVFGLNKDELISVLSTYGQPIVVGKSFPVIKIRHNPKWDFTLPETPQISYREACARRDFTINAMMMDVLSGAILDFFDGRKDLDNKLIRHTTEHVFAVDPLRVYRAVQLAARFSFSIETTTLELMKQTNLDDIKPERILAELSKLLLLAHKPSLGLSYMQETGILKCRHPMLFRLIGCEQSPLNHPEGDVWQHTLQVVDICARLKIKSQDQEVLMFAALLHDLGKPTTTCSRNGKITAYGHDVEGEKLARIFLNQLNASKSLIIGVSKLVREHMHPILLYKSRDQVSDKAIRKLVNRVNVRELLLLAEADFKGRGQERDFAPVQEWLNDRISRLGLDPEKGITPYVQGRDLIALGLKPGPEFRKIMDQCFEMQLEGKSRQEILNRIKEDI